MCVVSVSAQSYHYALDEKSVPDSQDSEVSEAENLPEEKLYFDSYLLPLEDAYKLQEALDTYGAVRLEEGNYPGPKIVLKSGQRLYGHPTKNKVPSITIKAGSKDVWVLNVNSNITFEAGAEISNCTIKNLLFTTLECKDCSLSDNVFINLDRCMLNWDCGNAGYFRNNKFIKHWIHGRWPQIVMKGNSITPSYGNVSVWLNLLTPGGHSAEFENLKSLTWVGVDAESWNYDGESDKPLLNMKKMGEVSLVGMTGGNNGPHKTPVFDVEAEILNIQKQSLTSKGGGASVVQPNTDVFSLSDDSEGYKLVNPQSGTNLAMFSNSADVYLDKSPVVSKITGGNLEKIKANIIGSQSKPWSRGEFGNLPDPMGGEWGGKRKNQLDQSEYIQNLVDSGNIAELDEGVYYIGSSIVLRDGQGIVGKGTAKTVLVGLTDDFPLIIGEGASSAVDFTLANMTLQGGRSGFRIRSDGDSFLQVTSCNLKFLVFRDQQYGIHLDKFYGFDNNFIDHVSFVKCGVGFYQEVDPSYVSGQTKSMMYVDKLVFYESQFINCDIGVSMMAGRADNLIAWVNCKFDGNRIAADLKYHIGSFFANCDFINNSGEYIIGESTISIYSGLFKNNKSNTIFKSRDVYMEGTVVSDNIPLFANDIKSRNAFIVNSSLSGGLGRLDYGLLVNSVIGSGNSHPLLIKVNEKAQTVLIDSQSHPYPQLLVRH
ncbi:hypothetical protein SAMN05421766_101868 [Zobellia uliginosa]|uniref:Right handed beta helix region n=1 Tax=Zobellia uliginosa TaxID=143224 RepID=A0ABY1KJT2_9FLAO|nr:hypothetical protein SAMN05421766_101868 [Zobellia uliginosa]